MRSWASSAGRSRRQETSSSSSRSSARRRRSRGRSTSSSTNGSWGHSPATTPCSSSHRRSAMRSRSRVSLRACSPSALTTERASPGVHDSRQKIGTLFLRMDRRLDRGLHPANRTGAIRKDLGARRRLLEFTEMLNLILGELQLHVLLGDHRYLLGGDVARPAEQARRNGKAVEDVVARIPHDLVHGADFFTLAVDDLPARLDDEPRNRVACRQILRPPSFHTGPCVATGWVSERT